MPRAQVFSDIHVNHTGGDTDLHPADCDLVLFAGDLDDGAHRSMQWLADRFAGLPIFMVGGNHDFYRDGSPNGYTIEEQTARLRDMAAGLGIRFLENDAALHGDLRILGCTLWTDFQQRPEYMPPKEAMYLAQNGRLPDEGRYARRSRMTDYQSIHQTEADGRRRRFTPSRSIAMHKESRAWLEAELARGHDGPTAVITHHAPTPQALMQPPQSLDWCYASDLESLMTGDAIDAISGQPVVAPEIWCCGHIHSALDLEIGLTRLVANPRGYPTRTPGLYENPNWNPGLVIDIEPWPAPTMRF